MTKEATGSVRDVAPPVGDVVEPVGVAAPVVDAVLAPIVKDEVAPVLDLVVTPVLPILDPVVTPVLPILDNVIVPVTDPGPAPAAGPTAPAAQDAEPINPEAAAPPSAWAGPGVAASDPFLNALTGGHRQLSDAAGGTATDAPWSNAPSFAAPPVPPPAAAVDAGKPRSQLPDGALAPAGPGVTATAPTSGSAYADVARGLPLPHAGLSPSPAAAKPPAFLDVLLEVAVAPD
jgi:hypothetical protein